MDHSYLQRFLAFVKSSFQEKFKAFMPGCIMGFIGSKSLLWAGVGATSIAYVLKFLATVGMAFSSGLATSYAAYLVDKYKERQKKSPKSARKNNKAA